MELRVGGKYRLGRRIGSGSFGDIYLGKQPMCRSSCMRICFVSIHTLYMCTSCFTAVCDGGWFVVAIIVELSKMR